MMDVGPHLGVVTESHKKTVAILRAESYFLRKTQVVLTHKLSVPVVADVQTCDSGLGG